MHFQSGIFVREGIMCFCIRIDTARFWYFNLCHRRWRVPSGRGVIRFLVIPAILKPDGSSKDEEQQQNCQYCSPNALSSGRSVMSGRSGGSRWPGGSGWNARSAVEARSSGMSRSPRSTRSSRSARSSWTTGSARTSVRGSDWFGGRPWSGAGGWTIPMVAWVASCSSVCR